MEKEIKIKTGDKNIYGRLFSEYVEHDIIHAYA